MVSGEPRDIPLPVAFVRSMTTPSGVRIHDWRSRTSGRIFEVPEVHVFAAGEQLREGDAGYLRFAAGHLYVLRNEDDPVPARRATSQAARQTPRQTPRQPAREERRKTTSRTTSMTTSRTPSNATRHGTHAVTSRLTRWLAQARRRADHIRLPRLSSTQWFLSMLGLLLLVVAVRLIVG
jgi:hypothetical protein